ncbi:MAG TPA: septal ring lytic transglycosylase RlpA family protein [Alphaproteobacteria bacterium]|nr:septal ring lytic transglycosylase RlpA family protein [Alphaproteobacteria bacterium]
MGAPDSVKEKYGVGDKDRTWNLQVQVPRSVLAAATFVAFVAGAADHPAQAKDVAPKHPGKNTAAPRHPHQLAHRGAQHAALDMAASQAPRQVGIASWYDDHLAGQMTASGDFFDPGRLTAAHRSLPLGTRIRVTRLATGDSVIVVVNDRGPYIRGRVLDLSPAAARALRVPARQNLPVKIEVVSLPQLPVRTAHR